MDTLQTVSRYQTAPEVDAKSLLMTLGVGCAAGLLCGSFASILGYFGFYLVLIVPLAIGVGVGSIMCKTIEFTKARDPWVMATAAFAASLIASVAIHAGNYMHFNRQIENNVSASDMHSAHLLKYFSDQPKELNSAARHMRAKVDPDHIRCLQVETFYEYMSWRADQGVVLKSTESYNARGLNLGFMGSILYWLLEALMIGCMATSMVWRQSTRPFCEKCKRWRANWLLGEVNSNASRVVELIESGNIQLLAQPMPAGETTLLKIHRCEKCNSVDDAVVTIEKLTRHEGKEQSKEVSKLVMIDDYVEQISTVLYNANDDVAALTAIEEMSHEVRLCVSADSKQHEQKTNLPEVDQYMQQLRSKSK